MTKVVLAIHGGSADCSESVRMVWRAVDVLPYGSYMWTGNEVQLLKTHGFVECDLSDPKVGDVLWRPGHTEMYLGNGMQGGARHDERGGIDGDTPGDQDGTEIARSEYNPSEWKIGLRYAGKKAIKGYPVAILAASLMDHIIDHDDAHGYSQPHRSGDGTIEYVTIDLDDEEMFAVSKTVKFRRDTAIYDGPSSKSNNVGTYPKGSACVIDGIVLNEGSVWGTYIGGSSGERRYVYLGKHSRVTTVA